ncbi:unnamed protein product [Caenorhabditis angaria]|uniref:Uncharacterized protein n=1 Tax=Caenorhabditis angaria TaxID=860376 RepID=A0A9P1N9E2_9PELO|nr:unnamed protein product [Caenorhabditis angaria]
MMVVARIIPIFLLILILLTIIFFRILNSIDNSGKIDDRSIILKYFEEFQKDGNTWQRNTTPQPKNNFDYFKNLNSYNYSTAAVKCNSTNNVDPKLLRGIKNNHGRCEVVMLVRFWHQPDILWFNYENVMKMCDEESGVRDIQIFPFVSNLGKEENDMKYWVALPKCQIDSNFLIKIGGDSDKSPEESLKIYIPDLQIEYIPKNPENFTDILSEIKEKSNSNSSIIIDMLWISHDSNIEVLELLMDKTIEKMNIVFCQINLEISKEDAEVFESWKSYKMLELPSIILKLKFDRKNGLRCGILRQIDF